MSAPRKGGGHSKGETMPYAVVWSWTDGGSGRTPKWTLGAALEGMSEMLTIANRRGSGLGVKVIDRATGETVAEPQRCLVCRDRWATEVSRIGGDAYTLCGECEEDDLPADEPADPALSAQLVAALRTRGLEPVVRPNGTVAVEANGIDWTLEQTPHAVTGEPCGVWEAIGPAGSRGQFVARNAAEFIARRIVP
ncbi:hypothetical protein ACW7N6_38355 [Streptomyces sp. UC1A3]